MPVFCWFRRSVSIVTRSVSKGEAATSIPSLTLRVTIYKRPAALEDVHSTGLPTRPRVRQSRQFARQTFAPERWGGRETTPQQGMTNNRPWLRLRCDMPLVSRIEETSSKFFLLKM